jgi:ATP-binding cassette, subfamily B, multidrug efflux pump
MNDEVFFSGKYSHSIFRTISMSIKEYRKRFIFCIFLGFLGRAFLLANANIIGKWADNLCQGSKICGVGNGIFSNFTDSDFFKILLIFSFLGLFLSIIFRITVSRMGTHSAAIFYDETTLRVSRFPMTFFDTNPVGRIITRFSSDYSAITRMSGGPLTEVLSISFDLILYFTFIMIASPYFIPILLFSVFLNYYVYKLNKFKIRKERREVSVIRGPALAHFAETVQGAKIIRVFGKDINFKNRFVSKINSYIVQKNKTNLCVSLFSLQMALLNVSLLLITGILGIWFVHRGYVSVGSLGVAFTFISMTSTTIQVFFEWISALEEALTGVERMDEFLHKEIEGGAVLPVSTKFITKHKILSVEEDKSIKISKIFDTKNANLLVENLSLRYHQNFPLALKNVSFKINNGEKIGIIGKTGSGKSSLIQALFHLYPYHEGNVKINGYEADVGQVKSGDGKYINLELFRSAISLIAQEPAIFAATLRENFIINKNVSDEEIIYVGKLVGLGKLLSNGKKSLDLVIQEKGADLSLGEKQLICMARCLLQNSPIVLMDEATSSIDPFSEELLVNATKKFLQGKTQIIVAHRLTTIEDCDRILWLDSGKLIMDGSAKTVLNAFRRFEGTQMH